MELGQLETFAAIAREKSFSRAAERLFRTQPAVSLALKRLEEELGEVLVDRTTKGGTLTDAGETLLPLAHRMLELRQQITDTFGTLKGLHQGRLSIGANESMSEFLLPRMLLTFQRAHPDIKLQAYRLPSDRIPTEILEHRLDVGFVSYDPLHSGLRSEVVFRDHMVLVLPPGHRLSGRRSVDVKALGEETFIIHNALTPTRAAIVDLFARFRTPLRITMEVGTLATISDFVAKGAGLAIMPRMTVLDAIESGRLVEVPVRQLKIEKLIRMVCRREEALSHAAKAFIAMVHASEMSIPATQALNRPSRRNRP